MSSNSEAIEIDSKATVSSYTIESSKSIRSLDAGALSSVSIENKTVSSYEIESKKIALASIATTTVSSYEVEGIRIAVAAIASTTVSSYEIENMAATSGLGLSSSGIKS